jgi:RimJ/RimL family protein N-acetyltransferase
MGSCLDRRDDDVTRMILWFRRSEIKGPYRARRVTNFRRRSLAVARAAITDGCYSVQHSALADPKEWERHLTLQDGRAVYLRPLRPEDERLYSPFFTAETAEDLRRRFFAPVKAFSHAFIARLTHIDYAKAMAFIAVDETTGGMLGVARLHDTAEGRSGEYAILIRSDLKSHGLGWHLMEMIIAYSRAKGLRCIEGQVLHDNTAMLDMCKELGFKISSNPDEPYICDVTLSL